MYCCIILCVLLATEIAKTQGTGHSYIKLHRLGDGAVKVNSRITFECNFRKTSKRVTIELHAIDRDNQTTKLKTWYDMDVEYYTWSTTDGYARYEHTVTDSAKYQCKMRQYGPYSSSTSNMYAPHIWRARMKDFPANFTEFKLATVNCSVQWVKKLNIAFTWYLDEAPMYTGFHTKTANNHDGTYNVTSSLKYTSRRQDNGNYLKCEARDEWDNSLSSTVQKMVTVLWVPESTTANTLQTTTTNTTSVVEKGGPSSGLYALFGVIGLLVVVAVVGCVIYVMRWRKKEAKKSNIVRAKREEIVSCNNVQAPSTLAPSQDKPEGMVYAELEMVKEKATDTVGPGHTAPQVIHGTENMVEYASIAWDKNVIVE